MIHMVGLMADGSNALLEDRLILLAPAVQHIGVALDHGDGRPKLVGGVIHETGLLPIGIPHPQQKVVHCSLHSGKVTVSKREGLLSLRRDLCDGFLQLLVFILGKRNPAQFVCLQRQLIQRAQDLPDLPVFLEIEDPHEQELYAEKTDCDEASPDQDPPHRGGYELFPLCAHRHIDHFPGRFVQSKISGDARDQRTGMKFLPEQKTHHSRDIHPEIHPQIFSGILPDLVEMQLPGDGAYFSTVFGLIHEGSSSQGLIT